MSNLIIKNPENVPIDPRIAYVLRCAKEVMKHYGSDPTNVTGIIRGKDFYGSLGGEHAPDTQLSWADSTFVFPNSEHIHGIQLYSTKTGFYIGGVSAFNMFNLDYDYQSSNTSGKQDSIVLAFTSGYGVDEMETKSPLSLYDGWRGNFSRHTKMVSIKNASLSTGSDSNAWRGKGVGRRIYHALQDMFEKTLFAKESGYEMEHGEVQRHQDLKNVLNSVMGRLKGDFSTAVEKFFDGLDHSKYGSTGGFQNELSGRHVLPTKILLELMFDPNAMRTFINAEGPELDILKKDYDRSKVLQEFKSNAKQVVCCDLTTEVVASYENWEIIKDYSIPTAVTYFSNMESFYKQCSASVSERISVLNIGLSGATSVSDTDGQECTQNYVMNVGLARHVQPIAQRVLSHGMREGQVIYFFDNQEGVV
jgi:hypothetical protein